MASVTDELAVPLPQVELIAEDGIPLETQWHRFAIALLVEIMSYFHRDRKDVYCNGNMFIYFSVKQARNRDYRGPDFFLVKGVDNHLRDYWVVWEEDGRYPDVIIELMSASTRNEDLVTKKAIYEKTFRTPEYFCYDPETHELFGWRLANHHYEPIPAHEKGWMWSRELGLWLGNWEGNYLGYDTTWLRFFEEQGKVVPTFAEAESQRAEAESKRAEAESKRAEAESKRAEAERQRAEAALAELARLKEQIQQAKQQNEQSASGG